MTHSQVYHGVLPTSLRAPEGVDERTYQATVAHILNRATPEQVAFLEEDPDDWRRVLIAHKSAVQAIIVNMAAEKTAKQQQSFRRGPAGREEWFAWEAQWSVHRGIVVEHLTAADSAMSYVNQIRQQDAQDRHERDKSAYATITALQARLEQLERRVAQLEAE